MGGSRHMALRRNPKGYRVGEGHHRARVSDAVVRAWALANGDNPLLRIALCGYEGEHVMPESWRVFAWKTQGGYGHSQKPGQGLANRVRERIWFSPHCLEARQGVLI